MNKDSLLDQLPKYPTNPLALALARKTLSDEEISELRASLTNRQKQLDRLGNANSLTFLALVFWIFVLAVRSFAGPENVAPPPGADALGWLFGLVAVIAVVHWFLSRPLVKLAQLVPLKDTDLCEMTLEWVTSGGANVAAWRDIALAERNQLYHFDHIVMYLLEEQHKAELLERQKQEAQAQACRALHGVPA